MKPSIPKGTRDFSPAEMLKRNYVFDTIRSVFKKYGYQPLETPSMENLSTLMGKYGEEGDKLIFKILNSGNYFDGFKSDEELIAAKSKGERHFSTLISEKALRYDLTVPFARYVVMHQHEITFPFRRYQIQPVWRADRPQRGRYREFYQCDADIIGTNSLLGELELIRMTKEVFDQLNLSVQILINNRKVLAGIAEVMDASDRMIDITVAIDKLDKIGLEKVKEELMVKGVSNDAVAKLEPLLLFSGTDKEKVDFLKNLLANSETGQKGISELEELFAYCAAAGLPDHLVRIDLTLARGLNYYTGAILEVKVSDERSTFSSSICGGGRYDDLTGIFGLKNMSGVGISFGADRICDVLEEAGLFPQDTMQGTSVLVANFGGEETLYSVELVQILHAAGIAAELFPDAAKMKKQLSYADANKISFVVLAGSDERLKNEVTVKNLSSGQQEIIGKEELAAWFSKQLNK